MPVKINPVTVYADQAVPLNCSCRCLASWAPEQVQVPLDKLALSFVFFHKKFSPNSLIIV